jgi:hypothetical protein
MKKIILIFFIIFILSFSLCFATNYLDSIEISPSYTEPVPFLTLSAVGTVNPTINNHSLSLELVDVGSLRLRVYVDSVLRNTFYTNYGNEFDLYLVQSGGKVWLYCHYFTSTPTEQFSVVYEIGLDSDVSDGSLSATLNASNSIYTFTNTSENDVDFTMSCEGLTYLFHQQIFDIGGVSETKNYTLTTFENGGTIFPNDTLYIQWISGDDMLVDISSEFMGDVESEELQSDVVNIYSPSSNITTSLSSYNLQVDVDVNRFLSLLYHYQFKVNDRLITLKSDNSSYVDNGSTFTRIKRRYSVPINLALGVNNVSFTAFAQSMGIYEHETDSVVINVLSPVDADSNKIDDNTAEPILDSTDYVYYDPLTDYNKNFDSVLNDMGNILSNIKSFLSGLSGVFSSVSSLYEYFPFEIRALITTAFSIFIIFGVLRWVRG